MVQPNSRLIPEVPRDLFANVGEALATWNECEDGMCKIISVLMDGPNQIGEKVAAILGNDGRAELLRHAVEQSDSELKSAVHEYLAAYSVCLENRNLIAHAMYFPDIFGEGPYIQKYPRGNIVRPNYYMVSADQIAQVVKDCRILRALGTSLWAYFFVRNDRQNEGFFISDKEKQLPLPYIPARPNKLAPIPPPNQKNSSRPPRS